MTGVLRELLAKATPVEDWRINEYGGGEYVKHWQLSGAKVHIDVSSEYHLHDLRLLVAAVNALPALLAKSAAYDELRAERDTLRDRLDSLEAGLIEARTRE